jgi:D-amino-acid dehydrogenase
MRTMRLQTRIEYGRTARGALKIFRDPIALERACIASNRLLSEGLSFRTLSAQETAELEPALAPVASQLAGAIHYAADETGDAYRFCVELAEHARSQGVEFRFRTNAASMETSSGRVTAVVSERERFTADRYVVAAGSYSALLLRQVGVHLPVRPAKGYSVTFGTHQTWPSLSISVIDDHWHAAVVPLEGAIRVAGTAEFAGYDRTLNADRVRNLLMLVQQILPEARLDPKSATPWCGLRAMSADGVPLIGVTPISNL